MEDYISHQISEEPEHNGLSDPHTRRSERSLILNILYAADVLEYQEPVAHLIKDFNEGFGLTIDPVGKVMQVVQALIQEREQLDDMIKPYLQHWNYDRITVMVRLILRFAAWELMHNIVDQRIVINEAIELAKEYAETDSYRLINGVLDALVKKQISQ